jgi:AhpD family alkylhydroperoxidase
MSETLLYTDAVDELVAVAAAVASNCEPCLRHHADADIVRAVQTARAVKAAPARNVARLAADLLHEGAPLSEPAPPTDASPCCGAAAACDETAAPADDRR